MRTKQELFDLAYRGLRNQGFARSLGVDGCLYRGPNGLKCALGHCLPDENYEQAFEGHGLVNLPWKALSAMGITVENENFATGLQQIHDDSEGPADMQRSLELFAAEHNLTIPD